MVLKGKAFAVKSVVGRKPQPTVMWVRPIGLWSGNHARVARAVLPPECGDGRGENALADLVDSRARVEYDASDKALSQLLT